MSTTTQSPVERAAAQLARVQERADRAFLRVVQGEVSSPAYAQRVARELEEAQATFDLAEHAQAVEDARIRSEQGWS